jgi:hypothetical protein
MAIRIGALAYFETSALQNEGHRELFEYVAEAALKKKIAGQQSKLSSDIRCFLSKSEMRINQALK